MVKGHYRKYQNVDGAAKTPVEIVHIEHELFYSSDAHPSSCDRSVIAVLYKPIPDCLEQMAKYEAVKQKEIATFKKA